MVHELRNGDSRTPLVLMGYFNPVRHYSVERLIAKAKGAGVGGLVMVDLPPEHNEDLCHPTQAAGLNFIRLTTPITGNQRLSTVLEGSSGFVYCTSVAGVTGISAAILEHVGEVMTRPRQHTDLPVGIDFGIRSTKHAATVTRLANGVVVDSALIDRITKTRDDTQTVKNVLAPCGELTEGARGAR